MRLEVVGGQNKGAANDVTLAVWYRYGSSFTVTIGSSDINSTITQEGTYSKTVTVTQQGTITCPTVVDRNNWLTSDRQEVTDTFAITISGTQITARRTDNTGSWSMNLKFRCTGTPWSPISGASTTLPAGTTATTFIEFQPPVQTSTVTQLELRINFYTATVGTSFILKEANLYALNECGEATYNQFKVRSEEEFYKVEVETPTVDFDLGQNFAGDGKDRTVLQAYGFIHNGFSFSTKDHDHDTSPGNCAESYDGGWWYSWCHNGHLTGSYPTLGTGLPTRLAGIQIDSIVGQYSSFQSLEMMIKPDTPYNNQGEGPIATVATCADLAAVSADCARRCIDRPMVHGGQHSMGTCVFDVFSTQSCML